MKTLCGIELTEFRTTCACCPSTARYKANGVAFCSDFCADFYHFGSRHCPQCDYGESDDNWAIIPARDGGAYSEYKCYRCGYIFDDPVIKINGTSALY